MPLQKLFLFLDFVRLLKKTVYDTSVFQLLDINLCFHIVYVNNFLLLVDLLD